MKLLEPHSVVSMAAAAVLLLSPHRAVAEDKIVYFSGMEWRVKSHPMEPVGPGPNLFCEENVAVKNGHLHLWIAPIANGQWCVGEVIGPTLGYGRYEFGVSFPNGELDRNVVLGLFTWSDEAAHVHHREVDIEISRWADPDASNAQCVVQPYTRTENIERFDVPVHEPLTLSFSWRPGVVDCDIRTASGEMVFFHTFKGGVPPAGDEAVRINLWLFDPSGPSDGKPQTAIIRNFSHTPLND